MKITEFSIFFSRDFEREILPMAQHFGMALAPWDVLGGGHLQSKKQVRITTFPVNLAFLRVLG